MAQYMGWGEGQRVTKQETAATESNLPVKQSKILRKASVELVTWVLAMLLLIGPDAGVVLGYGILAFIALKLLDVPWYRLTPYPKTALGAFLVLVGLIGAAWYWWGWELVASVWLPLYFIGQRVYVGRSGLSLPCPYWVRIIAGLFATALAWPGLVLAIRMVIELFDSNWPPVYTQREAGRGPWMPWHKPYQEDDDGREPHATEPRTRPTTQKRGITFMAPVTEYVDRDAIAEYGRRDASEGRGNGGNGNGVGH